MKKEIFSEQKGKILQNLSTIAEELEKLKGSKRDEVSFLTPQNILKMYTGIRSQTKLCADTGEAERNSLRYTESKSTKTV